MLSVHHLNDFENQTIQLKKYFIFVEYLIILSENSMQNPESMGKEEASLSSFICYNCKEKNYFDKTDYISKDKAELQMKTGGSKGMDVSIECKSCREINNVTIEF